MPEESQAQAAIEALNAGEFMGRPLNIEPAQPKSEAELQRIEKKTHDKGKSGYKKGRRSRSYEMRLAASRMKPKT